MNILVDSSANIGDVALDVPLYRAIARNGHHLEVVVGAAAADMLADCDFIARLHCRGEGVSSKLATYWRVTRRYWDAILITRLWPTRFKPISFLGKTAHRRNRNYMDPNLYSQGAIVYRLSMLDGLIPDWKAPIETEIPYKPKRLASARQVAGIRDGETYLTVAPGSARVSKRWAVANFETVIREVECKYDHIIVVGSPNETNVCQKLATNCNIPNVAGKMGLAHACALVSGANKHLGNDSGLCHVAAGNGVATLAVGGWVDGHYVPWHQHMLRGHVDTISPRQVIASLNSISQKVNHNGSMQDEKETGAMNQATTIG